MGDQGGCVREVAQGRCTYKGSNKHEEVFVVGLVKYESDGMSERCKEDLLCEGGLLYL